jgi:hypothetical protein
VSLALTVVHARAPVPPAAVVAIVADVLETVEGSKRFNVVSVPASPRRFLPTR